MIEEKIIDKIKKLMDKAESAKSMGNIHEAEDFAVMVSDLLTKNNLSRFYINEK